jgi:hypothetical protein
MSCIPPHLNTQTPIATMAQDPIDPVSDPRVTHKTAVLNGQTYHYLYAAPESDNYTHTVFLVRILPSRANDVLISTSSGRY